MLVAADNDDPRAQEKITALRQATIGNRLNIPMLAATFRVHERTIYDATERHRIPYIRLFNQRWFDPEDVRRALITKRNTPHTERRGRPRKRQPELLETA
jgi:hypothetical protein